ncbi:ankyrin repeat domain-containing protein [Pseudomonas solani]|uniref:ankyrin repeat domain-containing protein n=1 Tax=Pseudomonas solani TaxID=2731552 RepID=UPI003C2D05B3
MKHALLALLLWAGLAQAEPSPDPAAIQAELAQRYFDAARDGRLDVLQAFIDAGYDLDTQNAQGHSALILTAYHGHAEAVNALLAAGADPCLQDGRGNTALMGAIFKAELGIARRLMNAACPTDQRNAAGQTAAMYAALFQRTQLLDQLREQGADMGLKDALGNDADSLARGEIRTR